MKLIEFPEQTVVYAKGQPEYLPLPAFRRYEDPNGEIVCCWRMSWKEWILLPFNGLKIWHSILTFKQPLQPQKLQTEKPNFK